MIKNSKLSKQIYNKFPIFSCLEFFILKVLNLI